MPDAPLGLGSAIGMALAGIIGFIIGGVITMIVIEDSAMNAAAKKATLLCPICFFIGLGFGLIVGPQSWIPIGMPYRVLFGVLNYGCLGWFGGLFFVKVIESFISH